MDGLPVCVPIITTKLIEPHSISPAPPAPPSNASRAASHTSHAAAARAGEAIWAVSALIHNSAASGAMCRLNIICMRRFESTALFTC